MSIKPRMTNAHEQGRRGRAELHPASARKVWPKEGAEKLQGAGCGLAFKEQEIGREQCCSRHPMPPNQCVSKLRGDQDHPRDFVK